MRKKRNTGGENPYRLFLEGIPEAAAILTTGGEIAYANRALSKLLGRPLARISGVPFSNFVDPDSRKKFDSVLKSKRTAGSRREMLLVAARGEPIPVLLSSSLMPMKDGKRTYLIITDPRKREGDHTERREAESSTRAERQRLYEVMETLPAYVVLLSPDYHVLFANKFFRDRFGESGGRRCFEYLFERTEPCENCETYTVMRTGQRHHWEWTGPDGRTYDIHDFPFRDWDGSPLIMEMGIDITEQKRAQESQRQTSQYARSLIEASLDPLVTISSDGKILDVNEATIKATGIPRHKLIGTDFSSYFTEPEKARAGYRQVFAKGSVTDYPLTIRRKDGKSMDVLYNATVYKDSRGNVLGVFAAARDVTEHKRVGEELARHRDHLEELVKERTEKLEELAQHRQLALDAADMGWWHYDPDSLVSSWDDRFKEIFGVPVHSGPNDEILARIHPEDLPGVWAKVEAALDPVNPQGYSAEYRIIMPNGSMKWIEAHGLASFEGAGENRRATGLVGTVADITERKTAEEVLRQTGEFLENLFNYANAPIICWDAKFKITRFNPAFERLTNYRQDEVLGKDLSTLFPRDTREESLNKITRTLSGEHWEVVEIPILRKDGEVRVALWNSANVYAQDGITITTTIAQGQDITERKQAEERLRRSNENLEQFAYVASHDLQEPLRIITSYSQLLERRYRDKLDRDALEFIEFIVSAANHMQKLITDLLAYSRIGSKDLPPSRVDSNEVIRKVMAALSATIEASEARVTYDRLPVLMAPEVGFTQILQNLIGNALKFRGSRPPEIHVSARLDTDEWVFSVRDNGIGIEPQYIERIFQIFQRLHSRDEYPGTGIGLSICKKIVENWGGRIWVESEFGKGSTFHFTIPDERR